MQEIDGPTPDRFPLHRVAHLRQARRDDAVIAYAVGIVFLLVAAAILLGS